MKNIICANDVPNATGPPRQNKPFCSGIYPSVLSISMKYLEVHKTNISMKCLLVFSPYLAGKKFEQLKYLFFLLYPENRI